MTLQNANGPASGGTLPSHGSNISREETKMNKHVSSTGSAALPALSHRGFLGGVAMTAIPSAAVAATVNPTVVSIDDFLARASASEKAWYHANALAEVMSEMHPERSWRSHINHHSHFAMVVGDPLRAGQPVAKVYIDDGSPLLADDVTGTDAFASWEDVA
jgi:hypothetical protein